MEELLERYDQAIYATRYIKINKAQKELVKLT